MSSMHVRLHMDDVLPGGEPVSFVAGMEVPSDPDTAHWLMVALTFERDAQWMDSKTEAHQIQRRVFKLWNYLAFHAGRYTWSY